MAAISARVRRARVLRARRQTTYYVAVVRRLMNTRRAEIPIEVSSALMNVRRAEMLEAVAADSPRPAFPIGFGARRTWRGEYRR